MTKEELKFEIASRVFAQMGLPTDCQEFRELQDEIEYFKERLRNCNT